jgi:excisionase family DNA binding protein
MSVAGRDPGPPKPLAVTINEACRIAGLGKSKIYQCLADGRLRGTKVDRRRLILLESIERLLSSPEPERTDPAPAPTPARRKRGRPPKARFGAAP